MLKAPYDMVIVKIIYREVSSIIYIPDNIEKQRKAFHGEVVSIGPDYPNKDLKMGDHIIFPRHEGFPINYEDQDYVSLRKRWVLAIGEVCQE
jgi:co-chaperonin GroES (HSP10)